MGYKTKERPKTKKIKQPFRQPPAKPIRSEVWTAVALGLPGILLYLLLFWFTQALAIVVLPLFVSLYVSLWIKDSKPAVLTAFSITSIGNFAAAQLLTLAAYPALARKMPDYAMRDLVPFFYQTELPQGIAANPIAVLPGIPERVLVSLLLGGAAAGLAWVWRSKGARRVLPKNFAAVSLCAIACLCLVLTALAVSGPFIERIDVEPVNEQYAYDGMIDLKAYYLMLGGTNFFKAKVLAAEGDTRLDGMRAARDFYQTPIGTRPPTMSVFWKYAAPSGKYIFYWSVAFCVLALISIFYGAGAVMDERVAAMMPLTMMPYYYLGTIWHNILLQTWWASLLGIMGISFFVRKKYYPAAALILLSAMTRETMLLLLLVGFLTGVWLRDRKILAPFGIAGAAAAVFFVFDYMAAAQYITARNLTSFIIGPQLNQLLGATAYLMFPYGWFLLPVIGFLLFFPGLIGVLLIKEKAAKIMLSMFLISIFLWILNGNVSSYWGLLFMPIVLMSVVSLLFLIPIYVQNREAHA